MGYGIRELEDFLHDNYDGGYHGVLGRKIVIGTTTLP